MANVAITTFIITANDGILTASRMPMAMSRDSMLPKMFAVVDRRYGTPRVSILFTSQFMLPVIIFLNIGNLVQEPDFEKRRLTARTEQ